MRVRVRGLGFGLGCWREGTFCSARKPMMPIIARRPGEMWGRCRGDVGEMWGRCRGDIMPIIARRPEGMSGYGLGSGSGLGIG